ncbi:hypothetical protein CDD82_3956 [Ophiocordyceps australis]|uniref:Arrestin C-terminal-like domain-containing protein n=1 Tax=Ophiocordyceps australis TaxID=1399860 RepID=A0A2C5Z907_9HYPO|nr:hypothetical protein CDD82_3956 [Ophiocordyceps australis]
MPAQDLLRRLSGPLSRADTASTAASGPTAAAPTASATRTTTATTTTTTSSSAATATPRAAPASPLSSASSSSSIANLPPTPHLAQTTSTRASLLSRLSLPLRSRNRNIVDFHIRCDEPYRKFSAGDSVRGCVVLVLVRPLRITHLVVCLHGFVRVLRDPVSMAKAHAAASPPVAVGPSLQPQYHGNGLASLFQDEQVLSGDGRLEPGRYEFGFHLIFPDAELPSSIDFERGTISYLVTATLTRPTTLGPTSTCDRKVTLVQKIDIGRLAPSRPRTIFLEPISKRSRRKRSTALDRDRDRVHTALSSDNVATDAAFDVVSVARSAATDDSARDAQPLETLPPRVASDVHSEISGESSRSVMTAVSSRADAPHLSQPGASLAFAARQQVVDDKTITATIELLRSGCLPGDNVSVRVTVQHIKRVKSMTGVIVTLFRQGKIDTSPPLSSFADAARDSNNHEMAFPRSRTGLAGLSLSSTSSTSVFRKDLDQQAAPLIIDPMSLQASITVSVRMPDDAFPTIKGVPGDMISFKYQVEVVVDLGGRLAGQLQYQSGQPWPRGSQHGSGGGGGGGGGSGGSGGGGGGCNMADHGGSSYGPRRVTNMADTVQLRREKGVIAVSMETVVGTFDGSWHRKPRSPESRAVTRAPESDDDDDAIRAEGPVHHTANLSQGPLDIYNNSSHTSNSHLVHQVNGYQYAPPPGEPPLPPHPPHHAQHEYSSPSHAQDSAWHANGASDAAPSYIPSPQIPNLDSMTEKDRIRRAETLLLPSQPPAAGPSDGNDASRPDHDDLYEADHLPPPPPRVLSLEPTAPSLEQAVQQEEASAPSQDELSSWHPEPQPPPTEDKQELERHRLLNEASAPPEFPDDMQRRSRTPPPMDDAEPTAPVLDDDGFDSGSGAGVGSSNGGYRLPSQPFARGTHSEQLPAYER